MDTLNWKGYRRMCEYLAMILRALNVSPELRCIGAYIADTIGDYSTGTVTRHIPNPSNKLLFLLMWIRLLHSAFGKLSKKSGNKNKKLKYNDLLYVIGRSNRVKDWIKNDDWRFRFIAFGRTYGDRIGSID
eukprot:951226_1